MNDSRTLDSGMGRGFEGEYLAEAEADLRRGIPIAFPLLGLTFLLFGAAHFSSGAGRGLQSAVIDAATAGFLFLCAAILLFTRLGRASIIVPLGLVGANFGSSLSSVVREPVEAMFAQGVAGVCMSIVALALVTPRTRDSMRWALAGLAAVVLPEVLVRTFDGSALTPIAMLGISLIFNFLVAGYLERIRMRDFELRRSYQAEARTDALTGLINRRCFVELYQREIARLQRRGRSFSIAIVDIDYFKAINDRYGHQTGDQVLKAVAGLLGGWVRATDLVARWGGEEFAVLFPDLAGDTGVASAERIRTAAQVQPIAIGEHVVGPITISIGVTVVEEPEDIEGAIARADAALYRAKGNGRNRVEFEPIEARREAAGFASRGQAATHMR